MHPLAQLTHRLTRPLAIIFLIIIQTVAEAVLPRHLGRRLVGPDKADGIELLEASGCELLGKYLFAGEGFLDLDALSFEGKFACA